MLGRWLALSVCLSALATPAWGQRVQPMDRPVLICLQASKPTSVEFPEPIVHVGAIERPDLFSFDVSGPYVWLYPMAADLEQRIFVITQSGKQTQVDFKVCARPDTVVRLTAPVPQPLVKAQPFTDESFLRALRLHRAIPGVRVEALAPPTPADGRVVVLGATTIGEGTRLGMTLTVGNATATPLMLDDRVGEPPPPPQAHVVALTEWAWPPRTRIEAITAVPSVLAPGADGQIYIVFTRSTP